MNLLPLDLRKLVGLYISPIYLSQFLPLINGGPEFLINKAVVDLGIDRSTVEKIWNFPELLEPLTDYWNYVRVLSYFEVIVPGSERFLARERCAHEAVRLGNKKLINYFGKVEDVNVQNPEVQLYRDLVQGKITEVGDEITKNNLIIAIFLGIKSEIIRLTEKLGISNDTFLTIWFEVYVIIDNMQALQDLFPKNLPTIIIKMLQRILRKIRYVIPEIAPRIYRWIVSKLTVPEKKNLMQAPIWSQFFYYLTLSDPDLAKAYLLRINLRSLWTIGPYILFIVLDSISKGDMQHLIDINEDRREVNEENINIVINYFPDLY